MTRFGGAWHPRWNRILIAGAFIASTAIGASLGLEQRHRPITLAEATTPGAPAQAIETQLLDTHFSVAFFVVPQAAEYSPYGTPVSIPQIGIPAQISPIANTGATQISCDLIAGTISYTVFVSDANGDPVAGAPVLFKVTRSDAAEPQLVSHTTGFDGAAVVSVKVPSVSAATKTIATYSVLAEAFTAGSATPLASTRFGITDYTCSGAAGRR